MSSDALLGALQESSGPTGTGKFPSVKGKQLSQKRVGLKITNTQHLGQMKGFGNRMSQGNGRSRLSQPKLPAGMGSKA